MQRQRLLRYQRALYGIIGSLTIGWLCLWAMPGYGQLAQPKSDALHLSLEASSNPPITSSSAFFTAFPILSSPAENWHSLDTAHEFLRNLALSFGSQFELRHQLSMSGLVLIAPIVVVWWMRQWALQASVKGLSCLWFRYFRQLNWITLAVWLSWIGLFLTIRVGNQSKFGLDPGNLLLRESLELAWFGIPPIAAVAICYVLSHAVFVRLGSNSSKASLIQRVVWGQLQGFLPFALFLSGCRLYFSHHFSLAVGVLGAACLSQVMLARLVMQANDLVVQALTVGELRDRIFALAQPAGVHLKQVYVLPSVHQGAVNAFAVRGGNVMLTDNLLRHLTKRELDAVMAHELAHLQYKHPQTLQAIWVVAVLAAIGSHSVLSLWLPGSVIVPAAMLLSLIVYYFFSRRFEYQADRQATLLTNDPAAMITGLVKLAQIGQIPMEWGKREGLLMTHPSMRQRVETIAQRHHLNVSQIQQLAETARGSDHYTLPETIAAHTLLFSTAFKQQSIRRMNGLLILTLVLPLGFTAVCSVYWVRSSTWQWLLQGAGLIAMLALLHVVRNRAPLWGYPKLRQRLSQKLQHQGIQANAWDGRLVGLAPSRSDRLYEGLSHWDLGFLFLKGNRLCYVGEHTRFALCPTQINQIALEKGQQGKHSSVCIVWHDGACHRTFKLYLCDGASLGQAGRRIREMQQQIRRWQLNRQADLSDPTGEPVPLPLATLPLPDCVRVTSQILNRQTVVRQLIATLATLVPLTIGMSVLLHLPFGWQPGSWLYLMSGSLAGAMVWFLPLWLCLSSAQNLLEGTVQDTDLV